MDETPPAALHRHGSAKKHRRYNISTWDSELLNVVIEIPAGSVHKMEYDDETQWQMDRIVDYLPYPVNYGFLPKTLGGDNDPLDILFLSNTTGSGCVVRGIPIGVMRMMDQGEPDDKILVIPPQGLTPLADKVRDISDIRREYNGILEIISTYFSNYKGPGKTSVTGFDDAETARKCIEEAMRNYEKSEEQK